jgi:hypothetical protein
MQIMDCLVDSSHLLRSPHCSPRLESGAKGGPLMEAVLGRSLAHPHVVPTYDYAVSTCEVGGQRGWEWGCLGWVVGGLGAAQGR